MPTADSILIICLIFAVILLFVARAIWYVAYEFGYKDGIKSVWDQFPNDINQQ